MFYQGRFADALAIFSDISKIDPPAAAYEHKCRFFLESPPAHWNGVWVMTSK